MLNQGENSKSNQQRPIKKKNSFVFCVFHTTDFVNKIV